MNVITSLYLNFQIHLELQLVNLVLKLFIKEAQYKA